MSNELWDYGGVGDEDHELEADEGGDGSDGEACGDAGGDDAASEQAGEDAPLGCAYGRGSSTSGRILYVAFNQDDSCLCVGTREGVKIYSLETRSVCFSYPAGAISVAEMLFCTSLLAFVGAGEQSTLTPRRLRVMNTATQTPIRDLTFPASVLAAHMNRK
eukprot:jgi/Tetstr1/445928/TSEL_033557.t1